MTMTEVAISAQVWVCDTCGTKDAKTCGCQASAHMEKLMARAERNRQQNRAAAKKNRDKSKPRHDDGYKRNHLHDGITDRWQDDDAAEKDKQNQRSRHVTQPKDADDMPTEAEAEQSYQDTCYDHACQAVDEMADTTRQRFFAYLRKRYGLD